jgi:NAD(P)-dependent dehydrogenase (short-subunit alcohol dehydrogenase family)
MASRYDVNGKVVLVTGAARGIGAEAARVLAARGARLALVGLEPELLQRLQRELGAGHVWYEADVTSQEQLDTAVRRTVDDLGGIDVVVANAGIASYGTVRQLDPEAFRRTVDINLTGVFRTVHAALPHVVERGGYVLVVASLASFTPLGGLAAYNASKAGVEAFGLALRQEVAHLGVDVGVCHPSWIDTDMVRGAMQDLSTFRRTREMLPWPANSTTSVEECARRIANGIARRRSRVYVPRGVVAANINQALVASPLALHVMRRRLATLIPQMEREVDELGRAFAAHVPGQERSGSVAASGSAGSPESEGSTDAAIEAAKPAR